MQTAYKTSAIVMTTKPDTPETEHYPERNARLQVEKRSPRTKSVIRPERFSAVKELLQKRQHGDKVKNSEAITV